MRGSSWCYRSTIHWRTRYTVNTTYIPRWWGGTEESSIITKFAGKLEIEDLKTVKGEDSEGNRLIISRSTELKLMMKEQVSY
jgi:DNA-directed RNA polymerase subunit beta'